MMLFFLCSIKADFFLLQNETNCLYVSDRGLYAPFHSSPLWQKRRHRARRPVRKLKAKKRATWRRRRRKRRLMLHQQRTRKRRAKKTQSKTQRSKKRNQVQTLKRNLLGQSGEVLASVSLNVFSCRSRESVRGEGKDTHSNRSHRCQGQGRGGRREERYVSLSLMRCCQIPAFFY